MFQEDRKLSDGGCFGGVREFSKRFVGHEFFTQKVLLLRLIVLTLNS